MTTGKNLYVCSCGYVAHGNWVKVEGQVRRTFFIECCDPYHECLARTSSWPPLNQEQAEAQWIGIGGSVDVEENSR